MSSPLHHNHGNEPNEQYRQLLRMNSPPTGLQTNEEKREWLEKVSSLLYSYNFDELRVLSSETLSQQIRNPLLSLRNRVTQIGNRTDIALYNRVALCFNQCLGNNEPALPSIKPPPVGKLGVRLVCKIGSLINKVVKKIGAIWRWICQKCFGRRYPALSEAKRDELHQKIHQALYPVSANPVSPSSSDTELNAPSNPILSAHFGVPLYNVGKMFADSGIAKIKRTYIQPSLQALGVEEGKGKEKIDEMPLSQRGIFKRANELIKWIVEASLASDQQFIKNLEEAGIASKGEVQNFMQRILKGMGGKEAFVGQLTPEIAADPDVNALLNWLFSEEGKNVEPLNLNGNVARYKKAAVALFENLVMGKIEKILKSGKEILLNIDRPLESLIQQTIAEFLPDALQSLENRLLANNAYHSSYKALEKVKDHTQAVFKIRQESQELLHLGKESKDLKFAALHQQENFARLFTAKVHSDWAVSPVAHPMVKKVLASQQNPTLNNCLAQPLIDQLAENLLTLLLPTRQMTKLPGQEICYGFEKIWHADFSSSQFKKTVDELNALIGYFIPSKVEEGFNQSQNFFFKDGPELLAQHVLMPLLDHHLKKSARFAIEQALLKLSQKEKLSEMVAETLVPNSLEKMMSELLEVEFDKQIETMLRELEQVKPPAGCALEELKQRYRDKQDELACNFFAAQMKKAPYQFLQNNHLLSNFGAAQRLLGSVKALVNSLDVVMGDDVRAADRAFVYRQAKAKPVAQDEVFSALFSEMTHVLFSASGKIGGKGVLSSAVNTLFLEQGKSKIGELMGNSMSFYATHPHLLLSEIGESVKVKFTKEYIENLVQGKPALDGPNPEGSLEESGESEGIDAQQSKVEETKNEVKDAEKQRQEAFKHLAQFMAIAAKSLSADKMPKVFGIRDRMLNSFLGANGEEIERLLNQIYNDLFSDELLNFDRALSILEPLLS